MAIFQNISKVLHADTKVVGLPQVIPLPTSGSRLSILDIGWRSEDLNPASGSLIRSSGSLSDGDFETIVTPSVETNWSIGVRMPNSGSFTGVILYDSGTMPGWYNSGSNSSATIYVSSSNVRWGKCQTFIMPLRELHSGSIYRTHIPFITPLLGTYLKVHAFDGAWKDPVGNIIQFTEMRVWREVDDLSVSGSVFPINSSVNPGDVPPNVITTEIATRSSVGGFIR